MEISTDKIEYIGKHIYVDGKVVLDETANRIIFLIQNYLIKINHDDSGWETLYQDPSDKRHWELTYPDSESHGGGAPSLMHISNVFAKEKYKI